MNNKKSYIKYIILLLIVTTLYSLVSDKLQDNGGYNIKNEKEVKYTEFQNSLKNGDIDNIYIDFDNKDANNKFYYSCNNVLYLTDNPNYSDFKKDLLSYDVNIYSKEDVLDGSISFNKLYDIISTILYLCQFLIIFKFLSETLFKVDDKINAENNAERVSNKKNNKNKKTFDDVAGLIEVKKELTSIVDFLKNKEKYKEAGANLPNGILFYGPPGTGKTLLSKAIAGEANVPYFYMNGSDFVELYVGMGARRIRNLFSEAKKAAPSIIFIDEIDAIGGSRGSDGGNSEDRKTLNALLTEMDGFKSSEDVIVIAATNRLEDIDPALLRAGRFTEKYFIPKPMTSEERFDIIKLYSNNKKFAEDVDFNSFSKETIGCSPADIESIINDAAILSVQSGKKFIDNDCLYKAYYKRVTGGSMKEDHKREKEEIELIATHESGHAVIGTLLGEDVTKVTIVPSTNGAGGVTFSIPKKMGLYSKEELTNKIIQLYAGRAAEEIFYNGTASVTTGASNDIKEATRILKEMILEYGMNRKNAIIDYNQLDNKESITKEIEEMSQFLYEKTKKLVELHYLKINDMKEQLIKKETLNKKDIIKIVGMGNE